MDAGEGNARPADAPEPPAATPSPDEARHRIDTAIAKGRVELESGEPGLARLHFDHAMRYVRRWGVGENLLPELIGLGGLVLKRQRRLDEARRRFEQAAAEAKRLHLPVQAAHWLGEVERVEEVRGTRPEVPLEDDDPVQRVRAMLQRPHPMTAEFGVTLRPRGLPDEGPVRRFRREMLEANDSTAPPRTRYDAAIRYAAFLVREDEPLIAETYLEQAYDIARASRLPHALRTSAVVYLAQACEKSGAYERGGDRLMAEVRRARDAEARQTLLRAATETYVRGAALDKATRAARAWARLGRSQRGRAEFYLGVACRRLGRLARAEAAFARALRYQAAADRFFEPRIRAELALVRHLRGKHREAAAAFRKLWAQGLRDPLGARWTVAALLANGELAAAERVSRQYADRVRRRSGPASAKAGDDRDAGELLLIRASIADAGHGDRLAAWRRLARLRHSPYRVRALERLLQLLPAGDPERLETATALARTAEVVRARVEDVFSDSAWRRAAGEAVDLQRNLDRYLAEAIATGRDRDAVYELERFRSHQLVDVLEERASRWAGQTGAVTRKNALAEAAQRARYRYETLGALGAGWLERRAAAERFAQYREQAFTADRLTLMDRPASSAPFPASLDELLAGAPLRAGEALVFQRTTPSGTVLWLLTADGRLVRRPVPTFALADAAQLVTTLADARAGRHRQRRGPDGQRRRQSVRTVLRETDWRLGAPLAAALREVGASSGFLVPGTEASNLPIEHCPSIVTAGVQLALLPTSRALAFCRAPRRLTPPTAADSQARLAELGTRELIVIDPTQTLTYAPLEGAAAALEAGRRLQVEILAGQGARRDLVRTAAARVGYLHLIGHGVFDDANPYRSGMYMDAAQSPESLLTIAEVLAELEAPAGRLAVLSGCETGLRRPNPVSEEISLPAAFLAAGYTTVVASRWAVNDLSTSLLVSEFFRRWLAGGLAVGAALGEASRWLRDLPRAAAVAHVEQLAARVREVPTPVAGKAEVVAREAATRLATAPELPFAHPLHWAAFHVLGDPALTAPEAPAPARA